MFVVSILDTSNLSIYYDKCTTVFATMDGLHLSFDFTTGNTTPSQRCMCILIDSFGLISRMKTPLCEFLIFVVSIWVNSDVSARLQWMLCSVPADFYAYVFMCSLRFTCWPLWPCQSAWHHNNVSWSPLSSDENSHGKWLLLRLVKAIESSVT